MARLQGETFKGYSALRSYIVDANVIMSCLISGKQDYLNFFWQNDCYLPDFGMGEISSYQNVVRTKTKLSPEEFQDFTVQVFSKLTVLPNLLISTNYYYEAFLLCRDVDEDDTVYVAFSMALDYPLLTRDKPLAAGLRAKGYANIITLDELFAQTDDIDSTN